MKIDTQALANHIQEASQLSNKRNWTKQDERRNAYLLSAISALKAGASLQSIEQNRLNEIAIENGLPTTNFDGLTAEQESEARGWSALMKHSPRPGRERRDMQEGAAAAIARIGTYTGLGYFVPTGFFDGLFTAMAAHDFLFNPADVTFLKTQNGIPIPVPVASDIENVATLTSEAPTSIASTDIASTDHVTLGAYSFQTPRFVASIESEQDLVGSLTVKQLFQRFAADRLARGIGKYLVNGSGSGEPTGLYTALANCGAPIIHASGANANSGNGGDTSVNSLGTQDFANAFAAIDSAYLASDKIAWAMNMKTLGKLMSQLDKNGRPVFTDSTQILNIPIKICPSMEDIGASQIPVVLGDWSYFATRFAYDDNAGIAVYREAPGLIENGNVGLRCFGRADSNFLYTDKSAPSPFIQIRMAS
jgi:HK97 family phage major capsid protein